MCFIKETDWYFIIVYYKDRKSSQQQNKKCFFVANNPSKLDKNILVDFFLKKNNNIHVLQKNGFVKGHVFNNSFHSRQT